MLTGFWVFKAGGTTIYSIPFPRMGLGAIFAANILAMIGSPTLTLIVQHKNFEDTNWATVGTFSVISGISNPTLDLSPLKEMLRFGFTISSTNDSDGFLVNMTEPSWRPYA